jgi:hypothetical protein
MAMSLRRLALPLTLSLVLHALLIGAAWLLPVSSRSGTASTHTARKSTWSVCLDGPRRAARPRNPHVVVIDEHGEVKIRIDSSSVTDVHVPAVGVGPVGGGAHAGEGPSGGAKSGSPPLLAVSGRANRVAYVIDRSISMGQSGALKRAVEEVNASLSQLNPEMQFLILAYNKSAAPLLTTGWTSADPTSLEDARRRLEGLTATGATDHVNALLRAVQTRPDLIFLVTDADDLRDDSVRRITGMNQGRAKIHVVELARGKGMDGPLARLAESNGGTYRRVSPDSK